ncbi:UPF0481 protein At3g47200-like [Pistacia vera]|uniref:UPF0481 protein At3g47200-like n=1 Tax=Pistacia vera TaxID=55513 RepID=UPI001262EBA5|nr:UPF0481 protein At3g47200-like [Pistacia vera]
MDKVTTCTNSNGTSDGCEVITGDVPSHVIEIYEEDPISAPPASASHQPSPCGGRILSNTANDAAIEDNKNLNDAIDEEESNSPKSSYVEMSKSFDDVLVTLDGLQGQEEPQPKIQKVPYILRDTNNFKKYYEPRVISIGPYHHENANLKLMESLKLKLACAFIKEHRLSKDFLFGEIKKKIKDLRKCYEEEKIKCFNDDQLAWIFFVDGCTVLQYMYYTTQQNAHEKFKDLRIKVDCLVLIRQDLFLLENQLPYQVLHILISCFSNNSEMMRKSIDKFIFDSIKAPREEHQQRQEKHPTHLLDLLRTTMLLSVGENQMPGSISQRIIQHLFEFVTAPVDKFRDWIECMGKAVENFLYKQTHGLQFFRNVVELQSAGIRLRPRNKGCLTDITFSLGTLKIPPIIVDDSTGSKFLNLIAYERCPDFFNDFGVSSYIAFLDELIDCAQDVKQLRDKKILVNSLGSDDEVAKLFNEIGTKLVPDPDKYLDVKRNIQKRYNNKWMTWISHFYHRHFQNPWTGLAFLAAILALALAAVQAIYAVLSYYK